MGRLAERLGRGMAAEAERMDKAITGERERWGGQSRRAGRGGAGRGVWLDGMCEA